MIERIVFSFLLISLVFSAVFTCSIDQRPTLESEFTQNILYLSDIHFDFFYDSNTEVSSLQCKKSKGEPLQFDDGVVLQNDFGKFRCNTNTELLNAILDKTKELNSSLGFDKIVIMGDMITHYLNLDTVNIQANYEKSFEAIKKQLLSRFPSTPILFILGNNDFVERYNIPDEYSEFQRQVKNIEENFLSLPDSVDKSSTIFSEVKIDWKGEEISTKRLWYSYSFNDSTVGIFLNSVFWSSSANDKGNATPEALALEQLKFLEDELNKAKSQNLKVIIHNHIPMHCNYFEGKLRKNWKSRFLTKFEEIVFQYSEIIITIFSSHIHKGSLAIRESKMGKIISTIYMPSVSPSNGTNPGFSVLKLRFSKIQSLQNYYLDLNQSNKAKKPIFKEFDYNQFFAGSIDASSVKSYLKSRDFNEETFLKYLNYFNGMIGDSIAEIKKIYDLDDEGIKLIKCASYAADPDEVKDLCKHLNIEKNK